MFQFFRLPSGYGRLLKRRPATQKLWGATGLVWLVGKSPGILIASRQ